MHVPLLLFPYFTSCFYFCEHFYKAFKKKESVKNASVLQSHPHEEVIAYCRECQKKIRSICSRFETLSDDDFNKTKKNLIQYFSIEKYKGVCIIDINCFEQ